MIHRVIDLASATPAVVDEAMDLLLPVFSTCYPRADRALLRFWLDERHATLARLRVFFDDGGTAVGFTQLSLHRRTEIGRRRWTVFRYGSAVVPAWRGRLPLSRDMALTSLAFRLRHPLEPAFYFGIGSLPGYHFVVRNSHLAWPAPGRETPAWVDEALVSLGRRCFADEPGTVPTDHPLVWANPALAAPEDQAEWLRRHAHVRPEITAFHQQLTGGDPSRFVVFLVPGDWTNFLLTFLADVKNRARRAIRAKGEAG